MKTVAVGYGDPATWGSCKPYQDDEIQPVKLTPAERKKRSDAWVNHRINQYLGKTHFSRALKDVLFGATQSQVNRFYFECRRCGLVVEV